MLKIENTEVYGWEAAIRGMRNPKNSWGKSDSGLRASIECVDCPKHPGEDALCYHDLFGLVIGENDHSLMMKLAKGGAVHAKYRRMITVTMDVTAPLYWWKEFDTYKVGTVANSCSTMHKIHAKELTKDDFSHEHLDWFNRNLLDSIIHSLNYYRSVFLKNKNKDMWWQMIQLLPSSYNQKRTILLNYEVLVGMYRDRKNHKLDEWHTFCDWIRTLPYSELITGEDDGSGTV